MHDWIIEKEFHHNRHIGTIAKWEMTERGWLVDFEKAKGKGRRAKERLSNPDKKHRGQAVRSFFCGLGNVKEGDSMKHD
jgi:hypothetical protein